MKAFFGFAFLHPVADVSDAQLHLGHGGQDEASADHSPAAKLNQLQPDQPGREFRIRINRFGRSCHRIKQLR